MIAILVLAVIAESPLPAMLGAPVWNGDELKGFFQRVQVANQLPTVDAKDNELAAIAGVAYRVAASKLESRETYAKRILKARNPEHPNVKNGQWLSALYRQLYDDVSKRCEQVARIEANAQQRAMFENMSRQARSFADQIASTLEVTVEGLPGAWQPLAVIESGDEPTMSCVQATVKNGAISIDNLDRARFENDQPPADVRRTAKGAIKELVSAFKFYNVSAKMIGHYEEGQRKSFGHACLVLPAAIPSMYLNELAKAGIEAEMSLFHLMVMTRKNELTELRLLLQKPKPAKGKAPKSTTWINVRCAGAIPFQKCAERIAEARANGSPLFITE
jgi:hypothetical protein